MSTKLMVLSREGLDLPSRADRQCVDAALASVPTARIQADFGSILQVTIDDHHEPALRSAIRQLPRWKLEADVVGTLPIEGRSRRPR